MNLNWNTTYTNNALAICLRGVVYVPVTSVVCSMNIQKAFIDHGAGGSDG